MHRSRIDGNEELPPEHRTLDRLTLALPTLAAETRFSGGRGRARSPLCRCSEPVSGLFADLDSRPLRGIARRALPCLRDEKRHYQPGAAPPAPPGLREDRCRQTRGGEAGMRGREAALGEGRDTP